jgi:hypothetical protein
MPMNGEPVRVPFEETSTLIVVTDGITEARRTVREGLAYFGTAGVAHAAHHALAAGDDPVAAIHAAAQRHGGTTPRDDATVLAAHGNMMTKRPRHRCRRRFADLAVFARSEDYIMS